MSSEAETSVRDNQSPVNFTPEQISFFWERVDKNGPMPDQESIHYKGIGNCWNWIAGKNDGRYGLMTLGGKNIKAHRFSWMLVNGAIPDLTGKGIHKTFILHRCDNPACVNPAHLRPGTHADNMREAVERERTPKGDETGPRLHPECMPTGEDHWSKRFPEKWAQMHRNRLKRMAELYRENPSLWKKKRPPKAHVFKLCTSVKTAWEIRAMHFGGGWSQRELGRYYDIGRSVINHIIHGKLGWRSLDEKDVDIRIAVVDHPAELYESPKT